MLCLADSSWEVWKGGSIDKVLVVVMKTLVQILSAQGKGILGCISSGKAETGGFLGLASQLTSEPHV